LINGEEAKAMWRAIGESLVGNARLSSLKAIAVRPGP
jgi:hypothetical protein